MNRFLIPACLGAITTAALQAISQTEILDGNNNVIFSTNRHPDRTAFEQGGYQLIGFLLSFGIPLVGGLIVGLLYKLTNKYTYIEQFNDNQVFGMEGTGKKFISDP